MSTPQSWSRGGGRQADVSRRQVDEVRWSWKVTEMGWGTDKGGKRRERKEGRSYHDNMDSRYADFIISSFSDSDNGKSFHKKAITGGAILLMGGAIKWIAEKQPIIMLSSMEAEYVAANTVTRNSKWTTQFIQELGFQQEDPVNIYVDNQTAIKLAENPELHK